MLNYKDMTIDDIIAWCQANNQTEWLKEVGARKVLCKVYPKVNGKADKTQAPKIEQRKITFIQIKKAFVNQFMPEIAPKAKEKEPTMYEKIAAL